jgi:hypothetical protein
MSFNNIKPRNTVVIELSHSTNQSVASGGAVLWDTLRATGSHGVSVDGSGNITLDTSREYFIQASFEVDRANTSDSWAFDVYNSTGTILGASSGAFGAQWDSVSTSAATNATFTAAYVNATPLSSINIKATTMTTTSTVTTNTRIIIIEVQV